MDRYCIVVFLLWRIEKLAGYMMAVELEGLEVGDMLVLDGVGMVEWNGGIGVGVVIGGRWLDIVVKTPVDGYVIAVVVEAKILPKVIEVDGNHWA